MVNKGLFDELISRNVLEEIPEGLEGPGGIPCDLLEQFRFEGRLYGVPISSFPMNAYAIDRQSDSAITQILFELINFSQTHFR